MKGIILSILIGLIGLILGFVLKTFWDKKRKEKNELEAEKIIIEAEKKSLQILEEAKRKNEELLQEAEKEIKKAKENLEEDKKRILEKEKQANDFYQNILILEQKIREEKEEIENQKEYLKQKEKEYYQELENITGISKYEALKKLQEKIEKEHSEELALQISRLKKERFRKLEELSKEILAQSIQKYSGETNHPLITTIVKLKNDDEKGKVIGKDGRNIRTFERVTGVQLIIDDSPEIITISSFDPIRREVAARVLNKILDDGIVQPARIEEYFEIAKNEVDEIILEKGREALEKIGVYDLDEELIKILGKLHFRTSFGQNVLQHSIEVAQIAKTLAYEIGANPNIAKMAGLFHDIGKALDHEEEGSHVEIGIKILKRFGIDEEIIKAMRSHHREYPNENLESYLVDTADKISASRPGARSGLAENFLKKLEGLEKITSEFNGVNEAYALSAGREIRVFVKPDEVNDYLAQKMAKEIAARIEEELKYPGEIKVAVIREKRVIEYAK